MSDRGDFIVTATGIRFHPFDPRPEEIDIEDIAHALSMQCRFSGHTSEFYSVAQHSVITSFQCDPADALWGLLHDASEAYLLDVPTPVKRHPMMAEYRSADRTILMAVADRFGLPWYGPDGPPLSVHEADRRALVTEARRFMHGGVEGWREEYRAIEPIPVDLIALPPGEARELFLNRFHEIAAREGVASGAGA